VVAFVLPRARHSARSGFVKLGARKFLVIGIVMVAAAIEVEAGVVVAARVAVGAAGPKAQRLPALETAMIGRASDAALGEALLPLHLAPLSPIDDIRANAAYRRDAAATLIRRLLSDLGRGA
ncbi:MAG: xanthine dehydrogenase family protein subunit M, partial [Alphaproteobacteria bacterium]|nr:xanthine dehydrogenase family protein subunit M [Alphaproteobacteria bacterium]